MIWNSNSWCYWTFWLNNGLAKGVKLSYWRLVLTSGYSTSYLLRSVFKSFFIHSQRFVESSKFDGFCRSFSQNLKLFMMERVVHKWRPCKNGIFRPLPPPCHKIFIQKNLFCMKVSQNLRPPLPQWGIFEKFVQKLFYVGFC